jgi:hypothetical protein
MTDCSAAHLSTTPSLRFVALTDPHTGVLNTHARTHAPTHTRRHADTHTYTHTQTHTPTQHSATTPAFRSQLKRHFVVLHSREEHLLDLASVGFAARYRPYLWMRLAGIDMSDALESPAPIIHSACSAAGGTAFAAAAAAAAAVAARAARSSLSAVAYVGAPFLIADEKRRYQSALRMPLAMYDEQTILRDVGRTFPTHECVFFFVL